MIFLQDDVIILRPLDVTDADGDYPTWLNDEITCAGNGHHRIPSVSYTHLTLPTTPYV